MKRCAATTAAAVATLLLTAGPAFAHVSVVPKAEPRGSYSTVDFTVPNEEGTADTVKVEVFFPTDHPLASVQTEPVAGWTATVTKTELAEPITTDDGKVTEGVSKITWAGGRIKPGQFVQFPVSMGPLPTDTGELVFKTLQTYDNHRIARWIDAPTGGTEPAHPAPTLTLTSAGAPDKQPVAEQTGTAAPQHAGDGTARLLGAIGILFGAVGTAYGAIGGRRRRTTRT